MPAPLDPVGIRVGIAVGMLWKPKQFCTRPARKPQCAGMAGCGAASLNSLPSASAETDDSLVSVARTACAAVDYSCRGKTLECPDKKNRNCDHTFASWMLTGCCGYQQKPTNSAPRMLQVRNHISSKPCQIFVKNFTGRVPFLVELFDWNN